MSSKSYANKLQSGQTFSKFPGNSNNYKPIEERKAITEFFAKYEKSKEIGALKAKEPQRTNDTSTQASSTDTKHTSDYWKLQKEGLSIIAEYKEIDDLSLEIVELESESSPFLVNTEEEKSESSPSLVNTEEDQSESSFSTIMVNEEIKLEITSTTIIFEERNCGIPTSQIIDESNSDEKKEVDFPSPCSANVDEGESYKMQSNSNITPEENKENLYRSNNLFYFF